MKFMGLSSGINTSDVSSLTRVVSFDVLDVVPLAMSSSLINFTKMSDNSISIKSSDNDSDILWSPQG